MQIWDSLFFKNLDSWDFPGGLVVKMLCFHCRGHGSIPGSGTKILRELRSPVPHGVAKKWKKIQILGGGLT